MKINKLMTKLFVASAAVALPAVTLTGCSGESIKGSNLTSAYYNDYDMLTSLGITPNASNIANTALNYNVYPYISEIDNDKETTFGSYRASTDEYNLLGLTKVNTETLVLNEWAKASESKYLQTGVIKNVVYTSMADSIDAKYTYTDDLQKSDTPWHEYREGLFSYRKAFLMLANGLDEIYSYSNNTLQGKKVTYSSYVERANDIIAKDKMQIQQLRDTYKSSSLKDLNIGIIAGQEGKGGYATVDTIQAIYDPFIYPEIYGPEGIGMGVNFPTPNTANKVVKFADEGSSLASITSEDSAGLMQAFQNKFDKIIFVRSPDINESKVNEQLKQLGSYLKTEDNSIQLADGEKITNDVTTPNKTTNANVVVVNYNDWCPTTWGVYGKTHLLKNFIECLNMFSSTSETKFTYNTSDEYSWKQYKPTELVKPVKKEG